LFRAAAILKFMHPNLFQPRPVPGNDEIREILLRRIDQQKQAVGIVAGVIEPHGRRVVACGNLANGDSRALDGDTIFEIGSVSKVFTSLLLADTVSRQEVALDDPAAKYLPENVKLPQRSGKSITLLDLSTHRSGLPPLPNNGKPEADYSVDYLYQFLSGYTLPRDPGSEYEYSNLGAGLLGHLLARRAGTDYESLIGIRITRPLSMPDTGITFSSLQKQRMATGHNAMLAPVANLELSTLAGAGALLFNQTNEGPQNIAALPLGRTHAQPRRELLIDSDVVPMTPESANFLKNHPLQCLSICICNARQLQPGRLMAEGCRFEPYLRRQL
jgi:CubicO group peptidase (beta-lactamase class C family)